jgi:YggT family protein
LLFLLDCFSLKLSTLFLPIVAIAGFALVDAFPHSFYCRNVPQKRYNQREKPVTILKQISPDMMSSATIATWVVSPFLGLMTFLFIFRIILTWYPQAELNKFPFNLVAWPTEPFLFPTRKIIPPLGGVDISPIIWVGIFSLLREVLVGQQGLLTMLG